LNPLEMPRTMSMTTINWITNVTVMIGVVALMARPWTQLI
jgi:hypothetical protein